MKKVMLNDREYELIRNYKDGFNYDELKEKFTEYFDDYDYVLGDYAYEKLRLKGFYDSKNEKCNNTNNYEKVEDYIANYCAYECKYYILKKS